MKNTKAGEMLASVRGWMCVQCNLECADVQCFNSIRVSALFFITAGDIVLRTEVLV